MKDFSQQSYWEQRYSSEEETQKTYDWFKPWAEFKPYLEVLFDKSSSFLHLGCGNSTFSFDMYMDGYVNQTNIDYSSTVIETMSRIHSDTHIKYLTADIFKLSEIPSLQQHTFDIIIDKGTIDSFLTKSKEKDDQWNPTEITLGDSRKYLDQVISKLDIDGCFLQITWDPPHFRRKILECCDTVRDGKVLRVVEIKKVTGGGVLEYFIYVCKFINP